MQNQNHLKLKISDGKMILYLIKIIVKTQYFMQIIMGDNYYG